MPESPADRGDPRAAALPSAGLRGDQIEPSAGRRAGRTGGPPPAGLHAGDGPVRRRATRLGALSLGLAALAALALWSALTVDAARFDAAALTEALEARTPPLTGVAIVVTTVGSPVAMAALAVVVAAWRWWHGRRADAVLAVSATAGASLVFRTLKAVLDRARPPVADHAVPVLNESLPSGHATMSLVVIGTIVVLAWSQHGAPGRAVLVAAGALWVGAVGATRVYLGVHWVSDVLAGWAVGAAWLALCATVWSRRRTPSSRNCRGSV